MAGEQVFPALTTPFAAGGARVISSPFQFVADADTFLRVVSVCSVAGVVLAVQGRRVDDQGALKAITETHTPASTRTVTTTTFRPGVGAILNLTVFAASGAPLIGQCYVMVQLLRSSGATAIVLGTLLGGCVTSTQALGFPGSPVVSSLEVEPVTRQIGGTKPAAGAEISETCPTGARWEMLGILTQFQAGGAAGTRFPDLRLRSGGATVAQFLSNVGIAPGGFGLISWGPNLPQITYAGFGYATAAYAGRLILRAGDSFVTDTPGIAAADQYEGPNYQVREWLEVG